MQLLYEWILPIETVSEANCTQHWTKKHKRHKAQKNLITIAFNLHKPELKFPCLIKLIRLSPRKLDSDNLVSAFKYIRDEIASCINPGLAPGKADNDTRLDFSYDQQSSKMKGIKIQFYSLLQ